MAIVDPLLIMTYILDELSLSAVRTDRITRVVPLIKIAGLVDPSHKVHQGGMGSVWGGQTYGRTDGHFQSTSGHFCSTSGHFQSTSGSFPVRLGTMGGHKRHHSYSLPKK